jgi:CDP-glucose 4,6-dehydratase
MSAFHEGRPVVLRNPQATRPWQFVLDCLDGYVTLAEKIAADGAKYCGPWNFGPHQEDTLSVQDVVERLIDRWPGKASWVLDAKAHPHEAGSLRLDTSKTLLQLGWRPRLRAAEALDWTVDWYGKYFRGAEPKALCLDQIERFEKRTLAR